jgi:hypothetical protein
MYNYLSYVDNASGQKLINAKDQGRGIMNFEGFSLQNVTGRDQHGRLVAWPSGLPYYYLTIGQRIQMFELSSPVYGVVTTRMNRVSSADFEIVTDKEKEDEIVSFLKDLRDLWLEYQNATEPKYIIGRARAKSRIDEFLPDILPDLSNFSASLLRWRKRIQNQHRNKQAEIKEWLMEPNNGVNWQEFAKKFVFDNMIHGACAVYKQWLNGVVENFDTLAGGTVHQLLSPYFSGFEGYVQAVNGFENQFFYGNELAYTIATPVSGTNKAMIPLEALINKIAESLMFDDLMAKQADGTRKPEKMVIITNPNDIFSDEDDPESGEIETDEQKRIEERMNTPSKNNVMTFSGNKATILDLSRENTMDSQSNRQKDIREEVAMTFNMSNMEVNLTGSNNTSGRETSESQSEIEQGKGSTPYLRMLSSMVNRCILPFRYGSGYKMEYSIAKNLKEEYEILKLKMDVGEVTVNENRDDKGKSLFPEEKFNRPIGAGEAQPELAEVIE